MLISPAELRAQFERARSHWPFLFGVERAHGVPSFLLFAVGSRETNLTNETGDGGHGHGVFQLDDRWHSIPAGFDTDVRGQAEAAAVMMHANLGHFAGHVLDAVCAYNAGVGNVEAGIRDHGDPDHFTTHSGSVGYGAEVLARWHYLTAAYGGVRTVKGGRPPFPSWYRRELSYPCRAGDAGTVARTVVAGSPVIVQAGHDVIHVQTLVGALADGLYGPSTADKVAAWQRARELTADGIFGPLCAGYVARRPVAA